MVKSYKWYFVGSLKRCNFFKNSRRKIDVDTHTHNTHTHTHTHTLRIMCSTYWSLFPNNQVDPFPFPNIKWNDDSPVAFDKFHHQFHFLRFSFYKSLTLNKLPYGFRQVHPNPPLLLQLHRLPLQLDMGGYVFHNASSLNFWVLFLSSIVPNLQFSI